MCWRSGWPKVKNVQLCFEVGASNEKSCLSGLWWSVNLACGDLNWNHWGGLKLRKLVINDWVYVFPRVVLGDGRRVVGLWNDMYLFGGFLLRGSNAENWGDHRKKNFFINSVELSMCDSRIETVKYIWLNILYIVDWIFSQNCGNWLPLHTAGQLAKSTKS